MLIYFGLNTLFNIKNKVKMYEYVTYIVDS